MSKTRYLIVFLGLIVLTGCAGDSYKIKASENFPNLRPSTIAVLPVMNETVDLDAPKVFPKYIKKALLARGYYVADQEVIDKMLKEEGIKEAGQISAIPENVLGESLHVQGLLYTTVTAWKTVYIGVYASVTVGVRFDLIDAKTSELIWRAEDEETDSIFAVDDDSVAETAAFAAFQAYEPYAEKLVYRLLGKLPIGPFGTSDLPKVKIKKIGRKKNRFK
jgi:hypothetical protein